MSSTTPLLLLLLAVLAMSLYFLTQAQGGVEQLPDFLRAGWQALANP